MASLSIHSTSSSTITVICYCNTVYESTKVEWYIDGVLDSSASLSGQTQVSYQYSGLSPSTTYTLKCVQFYFVPGGGEYSDTATINATTDSSSGGGSGGGTTDPDSWTVASISNLGTITSSVSKSVSLNDGEVARYKFVFNNSGDATFNASSYYYNTYLSLSESTSFDSDFGWGTTEVGWGTNSITVSVESGTVYYLFVRHEQLNNSGTIETTITPPGSSRGGSGSFEWDAEKVSGEPFNITALEWCRLLNHINDVRKTNGYQKISEGNTEAYFTYPSSGDTFTALHYNQALNGITGMLGTGYNANAVISGEEITAEKINLLRDMINDI